MVTTPKHCTRNYRKFYTTNRTTYISYKQGTRIRRRDKNETTMSMFPGQDMLTEHEKEIPGSYIHLNVYITFYPTLILRSTKHTRLYVSPLFRENAM